MTEDEAKTKWCPFARMLSHIYSQDGAGRTFEGGYSYNRSPDHGEGYLPTGAKCIGSACMAWRATDNECAPSSYYEPPAQSKPAGYCGLAGRP